MADNVEQNTGYFRCGRLREVRLASRLGLHQLDFVDHEAEGAFAASIVSAEPANRPADVHRGRFQNDGFWLSRESDIRESGILTRFTST